MTGLPDPSAKRMGQFHFTMMIVWGLLLVPTITAWNQSILWLATMSLYANFVGHFSAWDAARADNSKEIAALSKQIAALQRDVGQRPS